MDPQGELKPIAGLSCRFTAVRRRAMAKLAKLGLNRWFSCCSKFLCIIRLRHFFYFYNSMIEVSNLLADHVYAFNVVLCVTIKER